MPIDSTAVTDRIWLDSGAAGGVRLKPDATYVGAVGKIRLIQKEFDRFCIIMRAST